MPRAEKVRPISEPSASYATTYLYYRLSEYLPVKGFNVPAFMNAATVDGMFAGELAYDNLIHACSYFDFELNMSTLKKWRKDETYISIRSTVKNVRPTLWKQLAASNPSRAKQLLTDKNLKTIDNQIDILKTLK